MTQSSIGESSPKNRAACATGDGTKWTDDRRSFRSASICCCLLLIVAFGCCCQLPTTPLAVLCAVEAPYSIPYNTQHLSSQHCALLSFGEEQSALTVSRETNQPSRASVRAAFVAVIYFVLHMHTSCLFISQVLTRERVRRQ